MSFEVNQYSPVEIAMADMNIDDERGGVKNICNNIQNNGLPQITSTSIHMIRASLRDVKPSSYTPRVVSIGPLHRSEKELQVSERHKVSYMNALFSRVDCLPAETWEECVGIVRAKIRQIRACYATGHVSSDDDNLVEMMVIDACFIVEMMIIEIESLQPSEYLQFRYILRDLLLLENQIPFFVLQDIFNRTYKKVQPMKPLTDLVLWQLQLISPFDNAIRDAADENYPHILGLFHNNFKLASPPVRVCQGTEHSAVELARHGVKLMARDEDNVANWALHIEFKPSLATLEMPVMTVSERHESVLRNLIAYEQSSQSVRYCISSFVLFLEDLVNTKEDLVMLEEVGIIENDCGSVKEAVNMIKSLRKEIVVPNFLYFPQWEHLTRHCNGYWPKSIAFLRRTAAQSQITLKNPWRATAIFTSVLLFFLTCIQTYYTFNPVK